MRAELAAFLAALRFLTRVPVPAWVGHSQAQLDRSARYFPLIGAFVGAIGAAATLGVSVLLPISLAILLGMVTTLVVTGAFHEDGLADSCDAFGSSCDRPQVLAIMKDSRIGSYGAIAIALALLIKFQALCAIGAHASLAVLANALVAAHAASRLAPWVLMRWLDYARDDETGKTKPLASSSGNGDPAIAMLFGFAPCLTLGAAGALAGLVGMALTTVASAAYFRQRIGGYTGDCLGASQQLAEIAFYLGLLCVST